MSSIPVSPVWFPVNVDALASNLDGGNRVTNHVAALLACQRGTNYVLAKTPRVNACYALQIDGSQPTASSEPSEGTDNYPTWAWIVPDNVANARSRRFTVSHLYRESDPSPTSDAYFERTELSGGTHVVDGTTIGPTYNGALGHAPDETEGSIEGVAFVRGAATSTDVEEGLATFNGYTPYSFCVQDEALGALDSVSHNYVSIGQRIGDPCLGAYTVQQVSDEFDDVRQNNLPALINFFADAQAGDFSSPAGSAGSMSAAAAGSGRTVTVRNTAATNILDQSSTSWSSTSPGFQCHVQYHGIGNHLKSGGGGNNVKITFRVLARADATHAATVDALTNSAAMSGNSSAITITAGSGVAWYGSDSNYLYLDSSVDNDDTSNNRNKIDVHASIANTAGAVQIYAIQAWMIYGV